MKDEILIENDLTALMEDVARLIREADAEDTGGESDSARTS